MAIPRKGVQVFDGEGAYNIVGINSLQYVCMYVQDVSVKMMDNPIRNPGFSKLGHQLTIDISHESWKGNTKAAVEKLAAIKPPFRVETFMLHKVGFLNGDKSIKPMKIRQMRIIKVEYDPAKPLTIKVAFDQSESWAGRNMA